MGHVAQTPSRGLIIMVITAVLAGCGSAAPRQYQTALSDGASLECRALQSVIEERERYGIVAASEEQDEDALRQCGLPHSSGGGSPFRSTQSVPASGGPQEVKIERRGDTYRVPVRINDTITLPFLLDTGAADLVIPADVALTLIRVTWWSSTRFKSVSTS